MTTKTSEPVVSSEKKHLKSYTPTCDKWEKMAAFLHCFNEKFKPGDILMCAGRIMSSPQRSFLGAKCNAEDSPEQLRSTLLCSFPFAFI